MLIALSLLIFRGEIAILNYGFFMISTVCCLKCKGRASYLNQSYLTTSFSTPNQVKIYLYGDNVFVFILL